MMPALQRTLQTVGRQLKGLTPTAKLLIGSLMIVMVMALMLVSLYAGDPALTPLGLSASMSGEARMRAANYLQSHRIAYEEAGGDLLVPADQKYTILAQLSDQNLVNADQIDFEKLVADLNPFHTQYQSRQRYHVAKMNVLERMISQMSGIERATVLLDQPEVMHGIGKAHVPASASVTVLPRTELAQSQVDAIAHLVSRAHAGLKPQNVAIIDARTGRLVQARNEDVLNAGKYLEVKLAAERHAKSTIEAALNYIPNVLIAVNAQVDTKEIIEQQNEYDEPKIGPTSESSRTMSSSSQPPALEAGVRPNTGLNVGPTRSGSQVSDERAESRSIPFVGNQQRQIRNATGYALQINATIGVPKSYFVRLYRDRLNDPNAQVDLAALDALVQTESQAIRDYITPLIDTGALDGAVAGQVSVSIVPDFAAPLGGGDGEVVIGTERIASASGSGISDGLIKYISLGGLAVVAIGMMLLMVRKASVREPLPTASELVGIPPALAAAEADLVGEADEASPALEGLELNDDAIRQQQMIEQITDMIKGTPEDAAGLLRRWIKAEA